MPTNRPLWIAIGLLAVGMVIAYFAFDWPKPEPPKMILRDRYIL